ncbi:MAG TPA: hypothetical protein VM509_12295, partial [Planctomycetota bacterium]|nr:hypothetical protein [Planctomycetota bacterium]
EVLREAAQRGRFIVIDAPPALGRLESRLLVQHADAAVLVLRAGATRIDAAKRAQRMLLEAGTPLLGSVFNAFTGAKERRASQAYEYPRITETLVDELEAQSFTRPGIEREAPLPIATIVPAAPPLMTPLVAVGGMVSEQEHLHQVDMLERRIAKLTAQLAEAEAAIQRIAKMKNIDLGIASIYRTVQGLSDEEDALALKQELMQKIFEANFELKQTIQRRATAGGTRLAK